MFKIIAAGDSAIMLDEWSNDLIAEFGPGKTIQRSVDQASLVGVRKCSDRFQRTTTDDVKLLDQEQSRRVTTRSIDTRLDLWSILWGNVTSRSTFLEFWRPWNMTEEHRRMARVSDDRICADSCILSL